MPLLGAPQEVAQETRPAFPSGASRGFAAGHPRRGCRRGLFMPVSARQGFLLSRFCLKFMRIWVCCRGKICCYPVGDDVLGGPLCTTKTKAQPFRLRFHPLFFIFIRAINIFKSIFATLYHQIVKRDLLGLRQYFHFPHQFQGHSKCFVNVFLLFHRKCGHAYSPFPV